MLTTRRISHSFISTSSILIVLCVAIVAPLSAWATCPATMTHYWKFNEVSGPPYADAVAGNDATCSNCPTPVAGLIAAGQHFDGVSDEVNVPDDGSFDWGQDDSFSILYWLRTSASTAGNRVLVGRDDGSSNLHWWTGADASGWVGFQLRDVNGNGVYIGDKGPLLNDGDWHFVVAVRDNGADMNRVYVDGVKVDSASHDYTAGFAGTVAVNVGYLNLSGHFRFEGTMDEVATVDEALTDAQIVSMYNDGLGGTGYCGADSTAPAIISAAQTDARVGDPYAYDVEAVGDPVPTYQLITAPSGMTIDPSSGLVEWTPAASGSVPVTVRALNSAGTDDQSFTIIVAEPPICPSDMISYWKLDETSGTDYDDYYGGNDGQALVSAPTPTAGLVGGAQEFNGTSDRITVADDATLDWGSTQSVTVELWAKFTNVSGQNKVMIGRDGGGGGHPHWWLGAEQNTGKAMFILLDTNSNGAVLKGTTSVNDNTWHHIVGVKDESVDAVRLYVDGVRQDSTTHDYTAGFGATTTMGIGYMAYAGTPNYFYAGALDEIAIYDTALSEVEIYQHYINGWASLAYCSDSAVAPNIVSSPVTSGAVGVPYTYDVDATGIPGPQYALTTAPAGMVIHPVTGVISWTPSTTGSHPVTVEASNTGGVDTQSFSVDIPAIPVIVSSPVTEGTVGEPYVYDVDATGVPAPEYDLATNPAGMTINTLSGLINWTPTAAGDYGVEILAYNTAGTDTQSFYIQVEEPSPCPATMTHYWKFNEVSGPPYADAVAGNDATCSNCPTPVAGLIAAGQHFDGVSDEVNVPDDGSFDWGQDDSFSILYWLRTSASTAGNRVLVGRDDGSSSLHWWTGADASGRVRFQLRDVNGNGPYIGDKGPLLNDGDWHFVVAVRDNGADMNRVYVDGVKVDSASHDYTAGFAGTVAVNVGYLNLSGHFRFEGTMDEVATVDEALTDAQIVSMYNDGLGGTGYCGADSTAPAIISAAQTDARVGDPYAYDVEAVGDPVPTYQLITAPSGMTIDPSSGLIEWTPAASGSVPVTVRALNSAGTDDQSFAITVDETSTCPSGMISYWKLDETSGTDYDDYYGGNDGQALVSAPTPTTGLVGGAQEFNGTSDRITVADDATLDWGSTQSVTVELWAKFTNVSGQNKVMIGRDGGGGGHPHWWLGAEQNTGKAMFILLDTNSNGAVLKGTTSVNDNTWHHIVGVKDESVDAVRLYVDGVRQDSTTHDYTAGIGATTTMGIGYMAYAGTPNYFYAGALDEIAVHGRALSEPEIQDHYDGGLSGRDYCTGPPVATVLQGYATRLEQSRVVIEWKLIEAGENARFDVHRAVGNDGTFTQLRAPRIERADLSFTFTDNLVEPGTSYRYRVGVVDEDGPRILFETPVIETPTRALALYQNHPNPFNPTTVIRFVLDRKVHANLSVYDVQGRFVTNLVNQVLGEGLNEVEWGGVDASGRPVSSGVYFYRLQAGNKVLTRKMVLMK